MTEIELNELGKDNWDNYHIDGHQYFFKKVTEKSEVKTPQNNNGTKGKR
jgi:hypothetical protein